MKRRTIIWIASALLVLCCWIRWRPLSFDSLDWKAAALDRSSTRYRMRKEVLALFEGKNAIKLKAEVVKQLGPPDERYTLGIWRYRLGPQFMIDDWWLQLHFDEHDEVVGYRILGD